MVIQKKELIGKIKCAKKRVRILGVLPFNLDWDDFKEKWFQSIDKAVLSVEIIREAEHLVNTQVIIASDKRISGEARSYELGNFLILAAPEKNLRKFLVANKCRNIEPKEDMPKEQRTGYNQCFSLRTCYLQIPIPVINLDDDFYITFALTKFTDLNDFEQITTEHPWYNYFTKYFNAYFNEKLGAFKYSTEITEKGNRLEVIQSYNSSRCPLVLLPRDSFLSLVQAKVVVWALIFTRDVKLLIHKRKQNAKDNQGMWDKSVGGHVAPGDIDTAKAVAREIAEELYKVERPDQRGHGELEFIMGNMNKLIFIGEWLPKRRYTVPFKDVNSHKDEYYYFRIDYPFSSEVRNSERHLPNGEIEDVSVFVDVYVCIASETFDIKNLENSDYAILELYELKDAYNTGQITYTKKNKPVKEKFEPTPDLRAILRSSLWDDLASFSDYVKENYQKESE